MAAELKFDDKVYELVNELLVQDLDDRKITLYTIQAKKDDNPYPISVTALHTMKHKQCSNHSLFKMLNFFNIKHGIYCEL